MDIAKKQNRRWPRLKQELPTFIYFVAAQALMTFYCPGLQNMTGSYYFIVASLRTIISICFYCSLYTFPEKHSMPKINPVPNIPEAFYLRIGFNVMMVGAYSVSFLLFWYVDCYRMSNAWYAVWYVDTAITFFLMYRVDKRYQDSK